MKKIFLSLFIYFLAVHSALSMQVETTGWIDNEDIAEISALELDLKSDLKNDFKYYQVSLINKSKETIDIEVTTNKKASSDVNKIFNESLSIKDLMAVPKQLAVESYNEDVGTGNIAKAHKGLIYVSSTAGAIATGAGFLGIYPQQKTEEYFTHRKIKKEYKKILANLLDEFTMAPFEQKDFVLLVPLDEATPYIKIMSREDNSEVYTEFHQI